MIKKCCGNDVAAFAKLSHVTLYARTATGGNMSVVEKNFFAVATYSGAPNDNFRKNICSEDDLRSRIFGTFVVKFLVRLPLLGFSDI